MPRYRQCTPLRADWCYDFPILSSNTLLCDPAIPIRPGPMIRKGGFPCFRQFAFWGNLCVYHVCMYELRSMVRQIQLSAWRWLLCPLQRFLPPCWCSTHRSCWSPTDFDTKVFMVFETTDKPIFFLLFVPIASCGSVQWRKSPPNRGRGVIHGCNPPPTPLLFESWFPSAHQE